MNTLNTVTEEYHEYEDIKIYSTIPSQDTSLAVENTGEFDITVCPAYETNKDRISTVQLINSQEPGQGLPAENESDYETMDGEQGQNSSPTGEYEKTDGEEYNLQQSLDQNS